MNKIKSIIKKNIEIKNQILHNKDLILSIDKSIEVIINCFKNNNKLLFCGNGGSAADAQHLAAEFSGRFYFDRDPLYSEALHCNTSFMTAVGNDYGYDLVYSRAIKAIGKSGDVLVGISTSGNSQNVLNAMIEAKNNKIKCIAFTGEEGGKMKELSDILINIPSKDTPRIQEAHIMVGHIICEFVENNIFKSK